MDDSVRQRQIERHRRAIEELEELETLDEASLSWPPERFYLLWHVVVGMVLGGLGAMISLAANAIGAPMFGRRALDLIRVYLTFPMGAEALEADAGVVLTVGCLLYLATGAFFGVVIHLILSNYFPEKSWSRRFMVTTAIGIGLWVFNFYLVLSWLQPLLLGDNWIVRLVPWWVGVLTHLVFAWTILAGQEWGRFDRVRPSGVAGEAR